MIRIVLLDDHALLREGIKAIISAENDMIVVGETGDPQDFFELIKALGPDICIVDLLLGASTTGFEILDQLTRENNPVRVLVVSMFEELEYAERALRAGAFGYLPKSQAADQLVQALRAIKEGSRYLSPALAAKYALQSLTSGKESVVKEENETSLTRREHEILLLYGKGLNVKTIASQLGINASTVGTHTENIKHKLGLTNMAELMRVAYGIDTSRNVRSTIL